VFQSRQLVKNNISHMNSSYFTEEHQLFRESLKDFLQKEVVPHIEKWEKTGTIERFIWKKFGEMGFFGINYPEAYGGLNLDLFYTVILLEELQKIKSSGFAAAMWAHSYLAMTHLNAEGDERMKQDYLVPLQNYRTFTPLSPSQDDYDPFSLRR
jgi:acyl-CoA dehydrogenase